MKRIIPILVVVSLLISCSACSSGSKITNKNNNQNQTESNSALQSELEKIDYNEPCKKIVDYNDKGEETSIAIYNKAGSLISETDYTNYTDGIERYEKREYDSLGKIIFWDRVGSEREKGTGECDSKGRRIKYTLETTSGSSYKIETYDSYKYDHNNNILEYHYTSYSPTAYNGDSNKYYKYEYNNRGQVIKEIITEYTLNNEKDNETITAFTYDNESRPIEIKQEETFYACEGAGRSESSTRAWICKYDYTKSGKISGISRQRFENDKEIYLVEGIAEYNEKDVIVSRKNIDEKGNRILETFSYDDHNNRIAYYKSENDGTAELISSCVYEYDDSGNIVSIEREAKNISRYEYDEKGRIIKDSLTDNVNNIVIETITTYTDNSIETNQFTNGVLSNKQLRIYFHGIESEQIDNEPNAEMIFNYIQSHNITPLLVDRITKYLE